MRVNIRTYKGKKGFYIAQYPGLLKALLHFTFPADLFNQMPSQLLWEASSHMLQLICERLLVHISPTGYYQVLIYTAV